MSQPIDRAETPPTEKEDIDQSGSSVTPMRRRSDHSDDGQKKSGLEKKKPPLYKRPRLIIIAGILFVLALIFGLRYYFYARAHESTDDAFIDGNVVQISPKVSGTVLKVYITDNQLVKAGDLLVELDPRDYQAQLEQAKADLLAAQNREQEANANIDLTKISTSANLQQATAGVEQARASVESSSAQSAAALSRVNEIQQQLAAAQANAQQENARVAAAEAAAIRDSADLERYRRLVERDEISRQKYDQTVASARSSMAELVAARKRVAAAEAKVGQERAALKTAEENYRQTSAQIAIANAQVGKAMGKLRDANAAPQRIEVSRSQSQTTTAMIKQAEAKVKQAELNLSYTKIYAPENGRVTKKNVDEGQFLQIGQTLMAITYGDIWVTANFKETQLSEMQVGQPVTVSVDAYPHLDFLAHIDSFQAGTGASFSLLPPENATGNYVKVVQRVPVKIVFDCQPDAAHTLAIGMSVVPVVNIKALPDRSRQYAGASR
jgi:membrane fusion protein (multidrug efflux system)